MIPFLQLVGPCRMAELGIIIYFMSNYQGQVIHRENSRAAEPRNNMHRPCHLFKMEHQQVKLASSVGSQVASVNKVTGLTLFISLSLASGIQASLGSFHRTGYIIQRNKAMIGSDIIE